MPTLQLTGTWDSSTPLLLALLRAGFHLQLAPGSRFGAASLPQVLTLVAAASLEDLPPAGWAGEWYACLQTDDPHLAQAAQRAGACRVFSAACPASEILRALQNRLPAPGTVRRLRRGDPLFLPPGAALTVLEGILSTQMIHSDGAAVLLGLTGAGQMLVAHPQDECDIQILAHTEALVSWQAWEEAAQTPGFAGLLRLRLQQMEAWAAMQARPSLERRVMGILSLLAEQFGEPHPAGILINVRLTHAQLASAVGVTRATVTRLLAELRGQGKLLAEGRGNAERYVLPGQAQAHHC